MGLFTAHSPLGKKEIIQVKIMMTERQKFFNAELFIMIIHDLSTRFG